MAFVSRAQNKETYCGDALTLALQSSKVEEQESSFFARVKYEIGVWDCTSETHERIFMRIGVLGLLPRLPDFNLKGDAFWDKMSSYQRNEHEGLELTKRAEKPFTENSCPCYICGKKCLRRLYGKNPVIKATDLEKGYKSWKRGRILPRSCGKNVNFYNLRIVCSECSLAAKDLFPYTYALTILPVGTRTLASEEAITCYLDLLRLHFGF